MKDNVIKIALILATAREGRQSELVYNYLKESLKKRDEVELILVDVSDFSYGKTIPAWEENDKTKDWIKITEEAQAFIIVSPEYNHSFPGELKILLDSTLGGYKNKPVFIAGVSAGSFGGVLMVESLSSLLLNLGFNVLTKNHLFFKNVSELFANQNIEELDAYYLEKIDQALSVIKENI